MQLRLLERASEKKEQLCSMFRESLKGSSQLAHGGAISVVTAQSKIKQCLGLDQAHEHRLILLLLLQWSCSADGNIPVASIFRMLRLVCIEKLHKQQVRVLCL